MTIRFEKREKLHPVWRVLIPVICIILAFVACSFLILAIGKDPLLAYKKLFMGGFGTWKKLSESILQAIPLMFCALGVGVAFKMNINNIGAEGQYVMGAMAATGIALYCPWIPDALVIPAMLIVGFAVGAIWGMIAVAPKAFWGVNETIITLMFNYIALLFVDFLLFGAWRDTQLNMNYSPKFPDHAMLSKLFGTRINTSIFIALAAAVLIYLFFSKTTRGYQIRVIGASAKAARYAGMSIRKNILIVMLVSGGLAGLAGVSQAAGAVGRLQQNFANGAGYTAIIVAYLSKFNPFVSLVVSVLLSGLAYGSVATQLVGVPEQVGTVIQGAILFFVLGGEIFARNKLVIRRKKDENAEEGKEAA
ncbi:MAG: ABC transporter permease [Clostridia bacterium]|nr:ABC transporter permease [Clostridia bacterium]